MPKNAGPVPLNVAAAFAAAVVVVAALLFPAAAAADEPNFQDELLDRFAGTWVMTGNIAGGPVVHDLVAEWVLDHQYIRFEEVAREKDERGKPAYEAIVFIGWDEPSQRYACMWLDSTGGGGLVGPVGFAKRKGDSLPWIFDMGDGSVIENTFSYDRDTDTWRMVIEQGKKGSLTLFADVTLKRK